MVKDGYVVGNGQEDPGVVKRDRDFDAVCGGKDVLNRRGKKRVLTS